MGLFVPVVDSETPRLERGESEARHRSFHEPHTLSRGAATAVPRERDTLAQQPLHTSSAARRFIPSAVFRGAKPGYVFTRRPEGLGYYADAAQGDLWRQGASQRSRERSPQRSRDHRSRSRSRSRERRPTAPRLPAVPKQVDEAKLSAALVRKPTGDVTATAAERQQAALARLAEQRRSGSGAGQWHGQRR